VIEGGRSGERLFGRDAERDEISRLLERVRGGLSGVLVVRGEAGIGKTRLIDDGTATASDFEVLRVVGIESEMRLGFAALHQLLTPFLDDIDSLPRPQARALEAAFGMTDETASDPFLVGLASLTLVTTAASEERPLLIVVDDGQWLDHDSAAAIGFLARRLYADSVGLLVSMRDSADEPQRFDGLPELVLTPIAGDAAVAILDATVGGPLAEHVRAQLLAEARGNPLALVEFGRELSPDQLAGTAQVPEPLAVGRRLERLFLQQVHALPPETQQLLLVVAADTTGDPALIGRAGQELGIDDDAILPAQGRGLVELGRLVTFRHPMIRAAVYQGADPVERRRAHQALATVTDPERDPDQQAWHRSAATQLPDADVADELERAARRAESRGSRASSASLLARAAELTPDPGVRAARLIGAASADLTVGSIVSAQANLERARPDLEDPLLVARARQLEGAMVWLGSLPGGRSHADGSRNPGESVAMMLEATRALAAIDVRLARDAMLDTLPMALHFGGASGAVPIADVARAALSLRLPLTSEAEPVDLLLDALAGLMLDGYVAAAPLMRRALDACRTDPATQTVARRLARSCYLAFALSDDDAVGAVATQCAAISRDQGVFQALAEALNYSGIRQLRVGSLDEADEFFTEERELQAVMRRHTPTGAAAALILSAWRGREAEVREGVAALATRSQSIGLVRRWTVHAQLVLEVGLGNYRAAASLVREDWHHDLSLGGLRATDAVEAHVRNGDDAGASTALSHIAERATGNQSPLDLGLLARCEALLADDDGAEALFHTSVARLETAGANLHVARTRLVFGEWLRRQKRRRDAREQLTAALDTFESMGAGAFAERARVELFATGAKARKRVDETRLDLTPQESQIARLAAGGLTNPEIATRLFLSASTVDYHLRKVYRKLEISSRHDLGEALSPT